MILPDVCARPVMVGECVQASGFVAGRTLHIPIEGVREGFHLIPALVPHSELICCIVQTVIEGLLGELQSALGIHRTGDPVGPEYGHRELAVGIPLGDTPGEPCLRGELVHGDPDPALVGPSHAEERLHHAVLGGLHEALEGSGPVEEGLVLPVGVDVPQIHECLAVPVLCSLFEDPDGFLGDPVGSRGEDHHTSRIQQEVAVVALFQQYPSPFGDPVDIALLGAEHQAVQRRRREPVIRCGHHEFPAFGHVLRGGSIRFDEFLPSEELGDGPVQSEGGFHQCV